ncbi:MAG TPA: oxidoreductase, partial [Anaeromyxobacteraceae bacterium]|nr:oxidoreductase [Anaeromyxobacteraceae bacterium]
MAEGPSPQPPRPERVTPEAVRDLREQLTEGEDVVDPKAWAGSIPAAFGIAPRLRDGANRWFNLVWLL